MSLRRIVPKKDHERAPLPVSEIDCEAAICLDTGGEQPCLLHAARDPHPIVDGLHPSSGRVGAGSPLLQAESRADESAPFSQDDIEGSGHASCQCGLVNGLKARL